MTTVQHSAFFFSLQIEESPEKKVLMLGLDGAGKSCILAALGKQDHPHKSKPTEGFNVMCVQTDKYSLNIWESMTFKFLLCPQVLPTFRLRSVVYKCDFRIHVLKILEHEAALTPAYPCLRCSVSIQQIFIYNGFIYRDDTKEVQ